MTIYNSIKQGMTNAAKTGLAMVAYTAMITPLVVTGAYVGTASGMRTVQYMDESGDNTPVQRQVLKQSELDRIQVENPNKLLKLQEVK